MSSVFTEPSQAVGNDPTPVLGSVPSVAASSASFSGLPWTTPPQTPMSSGLISRPSSVSGSVLGKRDTSESEREDGVPKKRRIAPTLINKPDDVPPPPTTAG